MPHARNPLFTGREELLEAISEALQTSHAAGITQAITGLGGIGKSQMALEYAYRHKADYAYIFWIGAESKATLDRDYGQIARRLDLGVKEETEADAVREGVKGWLSEHEDYLLILDNADDPGVVAPYLPLTSRGHLLVTSRAAKLRVLRVLKPLELEGLAKDEAITFLLNRAGTEDDGERAAAEELADELGYLPLALEQAGAYIAAQKIGYGEYLEHYRRLRLQLLERGQPEWGPSERTVQTTWQASFEAVRATMPAAADLLTVSAFLHPEQIPYEFLILGAPELGEPLATALANAAEDQSPLWELLTVPANYSLIRRDPETWSYSLHRLVQEVIRAPKTMVADSIGMTKQERRAWVESAVRAVDRSFPGIAFETWSSCDRLLPHALVCARWVEAEQLHFAAAGSLVHSTGSYLSARARYTAAEPLLQQALTILEQELGPEHTDTVRILGNLALLYFHQGKLAEAEPLNEQALSICRKVLGEEHLNTASSLNNLAGLYEAQGKLAEAEPLYEQALSIFRKVLGEEHPDTASSLNNLAALYQSQGKLAEAEPLYEQALAICRKVLGEEHPDTASSLNNLAMLYQSQGKLTEAEPLNEQALSICRKVLGEEHPYTATNLNNMAMLYQSQGKLAEAEPLYEQALSIFRKVLGEEHPDTASSLNNLATLYQSQGKLAEAEPLYEQALAIRRKVLGEEHLYTLRSRSNLITLRAQLLPQRQRPWWRFWHKRRI